MTKKPPWSVPHWLIPSLSFR